MKVKKFILSFVAVLALFSLAACSKTTPDQDVVTMKGDTIRIIDIYNEAKVFPNLPTTSLIQNLTFSKMFEKEFGKQVTDKDVTAQYNAAKAQYGTQFSTYLNSQGLSDDAFQQEIRLNLLQQAAVDKMTTDKYMTQADLKKAWETYHPTVDAYVAAFSTKADADKSHDSAVKDASEFKKEAAAKKLEQKFDSASTSVPSQVMTAAFKLKDGQVSDVIEVSNTQTGATDYYIVYMIKNPGKGTDMKPYESQLKNYIKVQKRSDQTYVQSVIKHYLTADNVTVKEQAFSNVFSAYLGNNNGN